MNKKVIIIIIWIAIFIYKMKKKIFFSICINLDLGREKIFAYKLMLHEEEGNCITWVLFPFSLSLSKDSKELKEWNLWDNKEPIFNPTATFIHCLESYQFNKLHF